MDAALYELLLVQNAPGYVPRAPGLGAAGFYYDALTNQIWNGGVAGPGQSFIADTHASLYMPNAAGSWVNKATNVLAQENGVGLQTMPTATRLNNYLTTLSSWTALSSVTTTAFPGTFLGIFSGALTLGSGGSANSRIASSSISAVSGTPVWVHAWYSAGTSGSFRLVCEPSAGGTLTVLAGTIGALSVTSTTAGMLDQIVTTVSSGISYTRARWTPNFTANGRMDMGPQSNNAGETVVVYGGMLSSAPCPPLVGGEGAPLAVTGNQQVMTCPAGGRAFIATPNILRAYSASGEIVVLEWNDGTTDNRMRLAIDTSNNLVLRSRVSTSTTMSTTIASFATTAPGVKTIYGAISGDYARIGVVGGSDSIAATSGAIPVVNKRAFGGTGLSTTDNIYQYLNRVSEWPVTTANDTVFNAVKTVAQGLA